MKGTKQEQKIQYIKNNPPKQARTASDWPRRKWICVFIQLVYLSSWRDREKLHPPALMQPCPRWSRTLSRERKGWRRGPPELDSQPPCRSSPSSPSAEGLLALADEAERHRDLAAAAAYLECALCPPYAAVLLPFTEACAWLHLAVLLHAPRGERERPWTSSGSGGGGGRRLTRGRRREEARDERRL